MPDGSFRVTPMGTHKLQVAWFCDEAWIAKEKVAPDQAARGEGVELASAEEAVEHLKTRFGAQARAVAMLPIKFLPMTYHDMEELTQEKQGSFLAASVPPCRDTSSVGT